MKKSLSEDERKEFRRRMLRQFKNKDEIVKDIQRLLLQEDYDAGSIWRCGEYLKDNLKTNKEYFEEKRLNDAD